MRATSFIVPSLLLFSSTLAAQALPADAVKATMSALTPTASPDGMAKLSLQLEIQRDCDVSATYLSGHVVEAHIGDTMRNRYEHTVDGTVKLLAGTTIVRPIALDMKLALGGDTSAEGLKTVVFRWPDLAGAEASVNVVPDQSGIDLDALDYEKTKVQLITSAGNITIGFHPKNAPNHVKNFIKLSRDGFYDGTQFHRVIRGFMAQGGCPNTKAGATGRPGTGDPGYKIDAEFNETKHVRGIVSAARSQSPHSAGSQFFLMHGEATHLDGQYTAYGMIEEGLDVLDKIATTPCAGPQRSTPIEPQHLVAAIVMPVYKQ